MPKPPWSSCWHAADGTGKPWRWPWLPWLQPLVRLGDFYLESSDLIRAEAVAARMVGRMGYARAGLLEDLALVYGAQLN